MQGRCKPSCCNQHVSCGHQRPGADESVQVISTTHSVACSTVRLVSQVYRAEYSFRVFTVLLVSPDRESKSGGAGARSACASHPCSCSALLFCIFAPREILYGPVKTLSVAIARCVCVCLCCACVCADGDRLRPPSMVMLGRRLETCSNGGAVVVSGCCTTDMLGTIRSYVVSMKQPDFPGVALTADNVREVMCTGASCPCSGWSGVRFTYRCAIAPLGS